MIGGPVERIKDINILPSPYLTGLLDEYFNFPLIPMIETTRGCPFSCAFCVDAHAARDRVYRYDSQRTEEELYYIAKKVFQLIQSELIDCEFVDFGCGAGIDVILAAHKVGTKGQVIGVDFTDQMIEKAGQAVADSGLTASIELIVGDMEEVNLRDGFADVVMSNCVINLCADKDAVYSEAFRILKPGGRLAISDIIYIESIDSRVEEQFKSTWAGCVGGTIDKEKYFGIIRNAGFSEISIVATHTLPSTELESMVWK